MKAENSDFAWLSDDVLPVAFKLHKQRLKVLPRCWTMYLLLSCVVLSGFASVSGCVMPFSYVVYGIVFAFLSSKS